MRLVCQRFDSRCVGSRRVGLVMPPTCDDDSGDYTDAAADDDDIDDADADNVHDHAMRGAATMPTTLTSTTSMMLNLM